MALSDETFGEFGGAVSDLFGGLGELKSASAYSTAAKLNESNARISKASALLNAQLQERNTYQNLGTTTASTAATGFTLGGSAGDILREQAQQGALAKSVILGQGELQSQSYMSQAAAEQAQASAAKTAGGGGLLGGLIKGAGAVAGLFGL